MPEAPEWFNAEIFVVFGMMIGAIGVGIKTVFKGLKANEATLPATEKFVGNEMVDVKGEVRQLRQELRLEAASTRRHSEDEADKIKDKVSDLRDILVEIRLMVGRDR